MRVPELSGLEPEPALNFDHSMSVRIAIPQPTSTDPEYNSRSLPAYIAALESAGAAPVIVPVPGEQDRVAQILSTTRGVLLPGSRYDVEPERYGEARIPECGPADPNRAAIDELLLQDAFNLRKPILAICHGMQTLNVWLNGSLIQDIDAVLHSQVNHRAGRDIIDAHAIRITEGSMLRKIADSFEYDLEDVKVNSSHHQALGVIGDRLKVGATSPADGVIEAVEINSPEHFVLGVQWHPERTFEPRRLSAAIFRAFVQAAINWHPAFENI